MLKNIVVLIALPALAGCAGAVERHFGASGTRLVGHGPVALAEMPPGPDGEPARLLPDQAAQAAAARDAVAAALAQRGFTVDPQAATRIELSFTTRPAATGIAVPGAGDLSPSRHRWALQSCHHRVFRLTLAYAGQTPGAASGGATNGRGYAEEARCHGDAARLLPGLARRAVSALIDGTTRRQAQALGG